MTARLLILVGMIAVSGCGRKPAPPVKPLSEWAKHPKIACPAPGPTGYCQAWRLDWDPTAGIVIRNNKINGEKARDWFADTCVSSPYTHGLPGRLIAVNPDDPHEVIVAVNYGCYEYTGGDYLGPAAK